MRKYGAFEVEKTSYEKHKKPVSEEQLAGSEVDPESGCDYQRRKENWRDGQWKSRSRLPYAIA
jgi:hypothetical protein